MSGEIRPLVFIYFDNCVAPNGAKSAKLTQRIDAWTFGPALADSCADFVNIDAIIVIIY